MPALPIFSMFARRSTDIDVDTLSRSILGGRDTITTSRGAKTEVRGPDVVVDVDAGRGGVWSGDMSRLWRAEPIKAPDKRAVAELAQAALKQARLTPELSKPFRLDNRKVRYGQVVTEADGKRSAMRTEAVYSEQVSVKVAGANALPLFGGGGKFTATIGDGGQVVGMSGAWREAESVDEREVMRPEAALEAVGIKASDRLRIRSTQLGYYAAPSFVSQELMFPVYAVHGDVHDGQKWVPSRVRLVPATDIGMVSRPETRQTRRRKAREIAGKFAGGFEPGKPLPGDLTFSSTVLARHGIKPEDVLVRTAQGRFFIKPFLSKELLRILLEALRRRSFGASWIGEFGGLGGSQANAQGFVDELKAEGWERRFNWGNENAWKSDWLANDDDYVDDVDFVFYTGHASPDGWMLATNDASDWIDFSEVGTSPNMPSDFWGQENLEWAVVAACGPLQDDVINGGGNVFDRWRQAFDGLHLLMGYAAVTFDNEEEGRRLASYARSGMTLMQAWFRTAQEIQPSTNDESDPYGPDVYSAAMYVGDAQGSTAGDHLWGHGSVGRDIRNSTYRGCSFSPC